MPRPFTDAEREAIREKLLDAARQHFTRFGYRKANVGEIARDAGIGKGSFYLFFESKAAVFMAVAGTVEDEIRTAFLRETRDRPASDARERLEQLLAFHVEALDREPFLRVALDPEETSSLFREIPPSVAEAHQQGDVAFFERLLAAWKEEGTELSVEPHLLTAVLRALYVILLHRDLVGGERVREVLDLLTQGIARALTES